MKGRVAIANGGWNENGVTEIQCQLIQFFFFKQHVLKNINSMIRLQKVSHEESQRKINQPEGEVCLLLKKGKRMANIY